MKHSSNHNSNPIPNQTKRNSSPNKSSRPKSSRRDFTAQNLLNDFIANSFRINPRLISNVSVLIDHNSAISQLNVSFRLPKPIKLYNLDDLPSRLPYSNVPISVSNLILPPKPKSSNSRKPQPKDFSISLIPDDGPSLLPSWVSPPAQPPNPSHRPRPTSKLFSDGNGCRR